MIRMSNKKKNKIREHLAGVRKKSPEDRSRLKWILVIVFMVGIFFLWADQVTRDFSRLAGGQLIDGSVLPSYPEMPAVSASKTLMESGKRLGDIAEKNDEELKAAGDRYILEKDLLGEEEFSSLKFADAEAEDGEILLSYDQYYKDIPVLGCGLVLAITMDSDEIVEKSDTIARGMKISVDPEISLRAAGELAEKEAGDENFAFREGSLAIARYEDDYYLGWRIVLAAEVEGEEYMQEVLVGAEHGGIISRMGVNDLGAKDELGNVAG